MGETVAGLRERRAWLLKQVELTDRAIEKLLQKSARPPRPTPQELPGVPPAPPKPPRQPSAHEERHADFQVMRRTRLQQLGVEYVPDEKNEPAFIVVTMKRLREQCASDDEFVELCDAYLVAPKPASYTPPYPLRALAAEKWWRPLLEEIRARAGTAAH